MAGNNEFPPRLGSLTGRSGYNRMAGGAPADPPPPRSRLGLLPRPPQIPQHGFREPTIDEDTDHTGEEPLIAASRPSASLDEEAPEEPPSTSGRGEGQENVPPGLPRGAAGADSGPRHSWRDFPRAGEAKKVPWATATSREEGGRDVSLVALRYGPFTELCSPLEFALDSAGYASSWLGPYPHIHAIGLYLLVVVTIVMGYDCACAHWGRGLFCP